MAKLRTQLEQAKSQKIKQLEDKKNSEIAVLTKENGKKYVDIKNYFADIINSNLDLIKQLKIEVDDFRKKEERDRKLLLQIEKEYK